LNPQKKEDQSERVGGGEEGSRERVGGGEKERQRRETLPAQNKYERKSARTRE
jgi:hypothetical protein